MIEVLYLADVDLGAGEKSLDAEQVDDDTALDTAGQTAVDGRAAVVSLLDAVPDPHEVGFLFGEDDPAFQILHVLQKNLYFSADLDCFGSVAEFLEGDGPFGFEANIDQYFSWRGADHAAFDDFALLDAGEALIVHGHQIIELLLRVLGSVEILYADVPVHRFLFNGGCRRRRVCGCLGLLDLSFG